MSLIASGTKQRWLRVIIRGPKQRRTALLLLSIAVCAQVVGTLVGVHYFPGHFDWQYRVMSSLASQLDNPEGYWAYCLGIAISFAFVFPLAGFLDARLYHDNPRLTTVASAFFRMGALSGFAVGLERGLIRNVSSVFFKSHEAIAAFAFTGIFLGTLGFGVSWCQDQWRAGKKANVLCFFLLVMGPFFCMASTQLLIYLKYRHLGWVSPAWRELGVPVYLSFAFWQWLASVGAYLAIGTLCVVTPVRSTGLDASKNHRKLAHQR